MSEQFSGRARWRFPVAIVFLAVVWLAMLLSGRGELDRQIYLALYSGQNSTMVAVGRFFTALGEPTVLIAASIISAVWLWIAGHRHLPFVFVAITMVGRAASELQKYVIARDRPDLETHLVVVKTSSFPSGHANSAMIFYLTIALILTQGTRWRTPAVGLALLLAILVGLSRVMLGVHWPSDVVGGWAFGMLWVLLTLRLAQRFVEDDARR
jgi:membrane-associated phospholipid phosphatase